MFEVFLKLGKKTRLINPYNGMNPFYSNKRFTLTQIEFTNFQFFGLSYKNEADDWFENDAHCIITLGKVFYQYRCGKQDKGFIGAGELLGIITASSDYYEKIKGNFTIILFDKITNTLNIINDQLGLKPIYFSEINGEIYISNNLNNFKTFNPGINWAAVLERILFTYPIMKDTYYQGIFQLNGGEELVIDGEIKKKQKLNIEKIVFNEREEKFEIEEFINIFNHAVLQRAKVFDKTVLSLTGGFDGRTMVSVLLKNNIPFKAYSFGKFGGENTVVPLTISRQLGLDYMPVYLEEDYEVNYGNCSLEAIYFSDGLSFNERSNYPYVFNKLSGFSNFILSGLGGGELLRPLHLREDYMNQLYYDVIYNNQPLNINKHLDDNHISRYLKEEFIHHHKLELAKRIKTKQQDIQRMRNRAQGYLFYLCDLLQTGFIKYYGTEMHLERFYADNLTPYFDYDLIGYIFSTSYRRLFKKAFKSHPFFRWKGQQVYAHVLKRNYRELGKFPVDRGYKPVYLIHPLKRLFIPYLFYKRRRRRKRSPAEFTSDRWSQFFYREIEKKLTKESLFFNTKEISGFIANYHPGKYNLEFNRIVSLYTWLELL